MLPAFAIKLGTLCLGLSTRSIQEGLIAVTFKAAARFGSGAELSQMATQTNSSLGHVLPGQAHRMQPPGPHHLTSRAQIGVTLGSVEELRFRIDLLSLPIPSAASREIGHMGAELAVLTGQI